MEYQKHSSLQSIYFYHTFDQSISHGILSDGTLAFKGPEAHEASHIFNFVMQHSTSDAERGAKIRKIILKTHEHALKIKYNEHKNMLKFGRTFLTHIQSNGTFCSVLIFFFFITNVKLYGFMYQVIKINSFILDSM